MSVHISVISMHTSLTKCVYKTMSTDTVQTDGQTGWNEYTPQTSGFF